MTAIAAATKTYTILAQNGWTAIVASGTTSFIRISADPHTHPFFVFAGASAPAANVRGVKVCHQPFVFHDDTNGTSALFWVRTTNPGPETGGTFIDVFCEGGVLA